MSTTYKWTYYTMTDCYAHKYPLVLFRSKCICKKLSCADLVVLKFLKSSDLAGCAQQFPRLALYNFLFANYSSHLHPECEDGTPVGLQIDITLRQILGVVGKTVSYY